LHINISTDRIERALLIEAPRSRVWRALSNTEEFGQWFGGAVQGGTFGIGQRLHGHMTHPGCEHVVFDAHIERFEPERDLSCRWHPDVIVRGVDYSEKCATLGLFELQEAEGGTLLSVVEPGFDRILLNRRVQAFRMNSGGWDQQMENISNHVAPREQVR
jgi:uncharacterized protein YndB with AHSA1/START domain